MAVPLQCPEEETGIWHLSMTTGSNRVLWSQSPEQTQAGTWSEIWTISDSPSARCFYYFVNPPELSLTHTHTHTHSKHHTLLFFPTHCGYLSLLTSLVTTPRPPSHAALGSHCVFITIKESPACLAIRPHYSALRFLTLVTLWSVIWPALMQDFLAGVSPQVGGEVGRQTHTDYIRVDVHGS